MSSPEKPLSHEEFLSQPESYETVLAEDKVEILKTLRGGNRIRIVINMDNLKIYVGLDHDTLYKRYGVTADVACAARAELLGKKILVRDTVDWRHNGEPINLKIREALAVRLQQDLLGD